jgi:hypothetical protein
MRGSPQLSPKRQFLDQRDFMAADAFCPPTACEKSISALGFFSQIESGSENRLERDKTTVGKTIS